MTFKKNGDDPTARRRRAPDEVLLAAREVIRRHRAGESVRSIGRALGLARTSVARIVAEYQVAQEAAEASLDVEVDVELGAVLAKYGDSGPKVDDVRTAEDIMALNDLEYHRLHYLPADHPGRDALKAAHATGWRRVPHHALESGR